MASVESTDEITRRQQEQAANHEGAPARLLAGPGTGKTRTLTERVIRLVNDPNVLSTGILGITFTRAAAQELRQRVRGAIEEEQVAPRVSTLHAYALRQLLRNASRLTSVPPPLRIADDWEEREIIQPDLKALLGLTRIGEVRQLLVALSSDWETLRADQQGWEQHSPNPQFLGAWHQHRDQYGYTLRAELVYQLKRAMEQEEDFDLEGPPEHVLVDEYQDLNPCDLAVIDRLREVGAELYVAGDDDQSIYGFRNADPMAIRNFPHDVAGAVDFRLEVCKRCDPTILRLADFIIQQEVGRVPKQLRAEDGREEGFVELQRYRGQGEEAAGIASQCAELVRSGTHPSGILILLRSDRRGAFSSLLERELGSAGLPVSTNVGEVGPFDSAGGRMTLSLMRLASNENDNLAWRSLIKLDSNRLGDAAIRMVEGAAGNMGGTVAEALHANRQADELGNVSRRMREYVNAVLEDVAALHAALDVSEVPPDEHATELASRLRDLDRPARVTDEDGFAAAISELVRAADGSEARELQTVMGSIGATREDEEPVVSPDAINILSMHKAKGLEADALFVVAAEDEYIPGRATTLQEIDDERRLLYVSLTRARHRLVITYCGRRTGSQTHTGRTSGKPRRTLSRFLRDGPLRPRAMP